MAFDYTNLYPDTSGNGGYTKSWNYTTVTDNVAACSASGYFNAVASRLGIGDNIVVAQVDAFNTSARTALIEYSTLMVTSIAGGVVTTTAAFAKVSDVAAEATLARNANNLTSGAVPGARITSLAGAVLAANVTAPATPASGNTQIYIDSTNKVLSSKNDAGTVSSTVVPSAAVAGQFVTGIGADGTVLRNSGVSISATAHGDSAYAILSTDRYVYTNAAFTAARIWTLPAANSLPAGTTIWVQDAQNTVTSTNTLTVSRAGADTVNIGSTSLLITGAAGGITFTTDGVSNWGVPIQTPSTGGTGRITLANHGVLVGAAANPITQIAVGSTGQLLLGTTGADPAFGTMSQDATITAAGVITVTKTNNVAFAPSATTDTTNAANISSGTLPAARTNGHMNGEPSTGNAAAGEVGEIVTATVTVGSPVALTSGAPANVTSISLTAGDWDVSAAIGFIPGATTNVTQFIASASTTTGALDTTPGRFFSFNLAPYVPGAAQQNYAVPVSRFSLSATTTAFLVAQSQFTVSTMGGFGNIRARRVR